MNLKYRILLIEDEEKSSAALAQCLPCFEMVMVSTVRAAFRELFNHLVNPFSAIVLDLRLPDGRGPELITEVRARIDKLWPDVSVPIVVVTGMSPQEAPTVVIYGRGADKVLRKPIQPEELRLALIECISTREANKKFDPTINFMEEAIADSKMGVTPGTEAARKRKSDPPTKGT